MTNGHDTEKLPTPFALGMASAKFTTTRERRNHQKVTLAKFEELIGYLKQLPELHGKSDRIIMESAGLGATSLSGVRKNGDGALYLYNALYGLLMQLKGDSPLAAPEKSARDFEEATLLFDACRIAVKARPGQAAEYRKLLAFYASELIRLS